VDGYAANILSPQFDLAGVKARTQRHAYLLGGGA
jgi:hypothetical protein